ncbi:hypothetical protein DFH27DRAFT_385768 [Peziza echinospora]|nr:hypothetical protein DFH27DRAFT_385768 [Peziza echinospora]
MPVEGFKEDPFGLFSRTPRRYAPQRYTPDLSPGLYPSNASVTNSNPFEFNTPRFGHFVNFSPPMSPLTRPAGDPDVSSILVDVGETARTPFPSPFLDGKIGEGKVAADSDPKAKKLESKASSVAVEYERAITPPDPVIIPTINLPEASVNREDILPWEYHLAPPQLLLPPSRPETPSSTSSGQINKLPKNATRQQAQAMIDELNRIINDQARQNEGLAREKVVYQMRVRTLKTRLLQFPPGMTEEVAETKRKCEMYYRRVMKLEEAFIVWQRDMTVKHGIIDSLQHTINQAKYKINLLNDKLIGKEEVIQRHRDGNAELRCIIDMERAERKRAEECRFMVERRAQWARAQMRLLLHKVMVVCGKNGDVIKAMRSVAEDGGWAWEEWDELRWRKAAGIDMPLMMDVE